MSHPDRRQFLGLLGALGSAAAGWPVNAFPDGQVTAEPTPFFAPPDGQECLVRFVVSGLQAPAGRLRAFDRARRQLGTAGVVPLGDGRLYGELWLPLSALERIQTEMEAPGLRRPLVTWHTLTPAPRWTVYWVTVLQRDALEGLSALEAIPRAATTAELQRLGATVNPLPRAAAITIGDVPFLRMAEPAQRIAARFGLAVGSLALGTAADLEVPTLAPVLAASGVGSVALPDAPNAGIFWLSGPDGGRVLVAALPAGADPVSLRFTEGGSRMMRAVETFLWGLAGGAQPAAVALVVGTGTQQPALSAQAVRDWNARFAYPRIVAGDTDGFLRTAVRSLGDRIPPWTPPPPRPSETPTLAQVTEQAAARATERDRRAQAMIACLVRALPGAGQGLAAVANQLAFPLPGTLVFNPTSYSRTDLVRMADGSERVVTDVPPLGYAYFPFRPGDVGGWRGMEGDGGRWRTAQGEDPLAVQTPLFRVALDGTTGAVRSLVWQADGGEWAGEAGLNTLAGARLDGATREVFPGVGARIIAQRRSRDGAVRSTVTIYDHLPWVDVLNVADSASAAPIQYGFDLALDVAGIEWEIPAGKGSGVPPCDCRHLRWIRIKGNGEREVVLGVLEAAIAHVDSDGVVTSYGPPGECRYRIGVHPAGAHASADDPWRLGWGMEPCVTAPVPGTGGATLPSFGRLLVIDQPGIALVGMQPAQDGTGVIIYLQELTGRVRTATLGGHLLGFADARRVDLLERDLGSPIMVMRNGVGVGLAAHGIAALRLVGVTLRRA